MWFYCTTGRYQNCHQWCSKQLFVRRVDSLTDIIPPTRAALLEHCEPAVYQMGYILEQALTSVLSAAQDWGWTLEGCSWRPFWTTLPGAMGFCQDLFGCGCKKGCRRQCSCVKASLRCNTRLMCPDECDTADRTRCESEPLCFFGEKNSPFAKFWFRHQVEVFMGLCVQRECNNSY